MSSWATLFMRAPTRFWPGVIALSFLLLLTPRALAQTSPVYPDDSVQARETLDRVDELLAAGNLAESSRVLQALLDTEGDKVLESKADGDVFLSVRDHIHKLLLEKPALLERYRASEGPRAAKMLEDGKFEDVERTRLLTTAGLEAAVRLAQSRYELAKFEAARQTLFQLEKHPDRIKGNAAAVTAATLAQRLARFLPRDDVRREADRWSQEVGLAPSAAAPIALPAGLNVPVASPLSGGTLPDWTSLPAEPLVSSVLTARIARESDDEEEAQIFEAARQSTSRAWIMPTVVGDTVIVNNGSEITGFDRFTLATLWTIRPGALGRLDRREYNRTGPPLSRLEDNAWIVVNSNVGVASTGYVTESGREGDRRLHAFDISSGRPLWSIDPASLDRRLEGCSVRGEPVVSEGMLIVPMRRNSSVRRVSGSILVGMDLWTGELRWIRPLCSVGVPSFSRSTRAAERCVVHEGVVYRADSLGVIGAVEAESGRPVWVRRAQPPTDARIFSALSLQTPNQPWASSQPIIDGNSIVVLAPDSTSVLRLSSIDGTLLGRRSAEDLAENLTSPTYLLRAGDRLLIVTHDRVLSLKLSDFERSPVAVSPEFREPMMSGRVVVAGNEVLVPQDNQIVVLDPISMKSVASHPVSRNGNIVALTDGLLIADPMELHAFLRWETAEAILSKRIEASPNDPAPALSMANLAFRAGRYPRIVTAVDRVLDIRDRDLDSTVSQTARRRLIESLRNMLASGKQRWDPATESRALTANSNVPPVNVLADLAQRFARAAESPAELAEFELALGWLGEAKSTPGASIEAYGRLLADDSLAEVLVLGDFGVPTRAADIATDRLLNLLRRLGPEPYAAFTQQASRELEELGDRATPAELLSLAKRFPAAPAGATAWIRLADLNEKADKRAAAARCLALALRALDFSQSARTPALATESRHVGTRLVEALAKLNRPSEAARIADQLNRRPGASPIALPSLVKEQLAATDRRPRFGDRIESEPQALVGWTVASPKITDGEGRPTDRTVLLSAGRKQVGLFATSLVDNRLVPLWIRTYELRQPRIIRLDHDATFVYWPADSRSDRAGGVIECIRSDGTSAWLSREIASVLDEIDTRTSDEMSAFSTPLDGSVSPGDLLVAMDASTLVLIERVGRIVAFDLASGKPIWTTRLPSTHVYDGAISGNTLVIGGASTERNDNALRALGVLPLSLVSIDLRTGGPAKDLRTMVAKGLNAPDLKNLRAALGDRQQVRWLRSIGAGKFLAGMTDRVICFDVPNDRLVWNFDKPTVARSMECWVLGNRAFVLGDERTLVPITLADGTSPFPDLSMQGSLLGETTVAAALLTDGQFAFATTKGLLVFGRDGKLIGKDSGAMAGESPQAFAIGMDRVAMIPDAEMSATESGFDLRILSLPGGKLLSTRSLLLSRTPTDLTAIDGHLLVTAGGVTIVLSAPVASESLLP